MKSLKIPTCSFRTLEKYTTKTIEYQHSGSMTTTYYKQIKGRLRVSNEGKKMQ
jgi:hypothetical protein